MHLKAKVCSHSFLCIKQLVSGALLVSFVSSSIHCFDA